MKIYSIVQSNNSACAYQVDDVLHRLDVHLGLVVLHGPSPALGKHCICLVSSGECIDVEDLAMIKSLSINNELSDLSRKLVHTGDALASCPLLRVPWFPFG